MDNTLAWAIFIAGIAQFSVLIASAYVPVHLHWRETFAVLPRLHRQLIYCYAAFIAASIIALGLVCVTLADELASGSSLARAVCAYGLTFWGVRLALQGVFDVKPYVTHGWLRAGYHILTIWFIGFVAVYAWGAIHPAM
jgi:hypothetical protein